MDKVKQNTLMDTVTEFIKHAGIILILLFYLSNHNNTHLTVGNIILFISYIGYAGAFLQLFNTTASIIKGGENALERISEVINCSIEKTINLLISKVENDTVNDGMNSKLIIKGFRLSEKDRFHDIILNAGDMCLFLRKCTVVPEERIPLFRSKYTVRPEQDTACIILASASLLA